jgi:hypothetical protein
MELAAIADYPTGLVLSPEGNLYVVGQHSGNIVELDADGSLVRTVAWGLADPRGLAWDSDGSLIVSYAGSVIGTAVGKISLASAIEDSFSFVGSSLVNSLAVGPDGAVYATTGYYDTIFLCHLDTAPASELSPTETNEILYGLAFAPQRFASKLVGKLTQPGHDPKSLTEKCVVSMSPRATWIMVQLEDDVANPQDLTTVFGSDRVVLQGRSIAAAKPVKQQFVGSQAGRKVLAGGMAAAVLALKLAETDTAALALKGIAGSFRRDSEKGAFVGKILTGKKLN